MTFYLYETSQRFLRQQLSNFLSKKQKSKSIASHVIVSFTHELHSVQLSQLTHILCDSLPGQKKAPFSL